MLKSEFQRAALPPMASGRPSSVLPNGVDDELLAAVRAEAAAEAVAAGTAAGSSAPPPHN